MKRYIRSSWPQELTYDEYDEGDQIIEAFIDVLEDLDIFEEPSAQGGVGTDYFYAEDGDYDSELAHIDLQEEQDILIQLYYRSKSEEDFKIKIRNWLIDLCNLE